MTFQMLLKDQDLLKFGQKTQLSNNILFRAYLQTWHF
ncbi:hypothetical protein AB210_3228 [Acinetobacter baumannii AB210]|nr:hypothetical protein AB210_3228 [Acinetobacter baumannii AB210]